MSRVPHEANKSHFTELSGTGQEILEGRWIGTVDSTKIVNNYSLKQETVCQIVRFFSHLPLKLYWFTFVPLIRLLHHSNISKRVE